MIKNSAMFADNPPIASVMGAEPLSRRRVAPFLVLLPAAALLAACTTVGSDETQTGNQRRPTHKNGVRGRGGPGSR